MIKRLIALFFLIFLAGCVADQESESKNSYVVCLQPSHDIVEVRERLTIFSKKENLSFLDRGSEVLREFKEFKHLNPAITHTETNLLFTKLEKPSEVRISITNLGMNRKFAMSIRHWSVEGKETGSRLILALNEISYVRKIPDGAALTEPCETRP